MHKKLTTFIFILLLANLALEAQEIRNKNFNFNLISEDFIKKQDNFPIVRENDNYFIIDENEYLIIRENNESDYAIILDESLAKNTLHKTSIKLGPSENHNSSLGIILKANKNFSKALIFEINNEGKYRIKELKNSAYNYLSKKKNKWLKNKAINKLNKYNTIEIISVNDNIKIMVNNIVIEIIKYKNKEKSYSGILIGPETKARLKYFYLNTDKNIDLKPAKNEQIIEEKINNNLQLSLNELKSEIIDQKLIIENLKKQVSNKDEINDLNIEIKDLKDEILAKEVLIEELNNKYKTLDENTENNKIQNNEKLINLNEKIKSLAFENKKLSEEISRKSEIIDELKSNLSKQAKENTSLIEKNKRKENQLVSSSIKIKEINSKLNSEKSNYDSYKKQNTDKLNKLENKLNNLLSEYNFKSDKLKEKELELNTISNINKEISKEIDQLKLKNNSLKSENIEKTKNNSLLESELKSQKEDNRFLKDIFVYKDFELNDIDPNKLVLTKKKEKEVQIETQNISKNKSNYSIQLGVFHYPTSEYKSLKYIYNTFNDNIYTYFCGDFNNISDAKIQLDKLLKLGYSNIFIIENK